MLVHCRQMQEAEKRLFASGAADADTLMERAGCACARIILQRYRMPGRAVLFAGKGNNAGDAYVIGRELRRAGWKVSAEAVAAAGEMTPLAAAKREQFEATREGEALLDGSTVLVDGLLGIGAYGALRGRVAELAAAMNEQRLRDGAVTFAVDIPSGVDGDTGECYAGAVVADHTLTIAHPKTGLVADAASKNVGRIDVVPLEEIEITDPASDALLLTADLVRQWLPRRGHEFHKGDAGRVAIIAGSAGMLGAAHLCALGALRGGAGLVTVFARPSIYSWLTARLPAEVMVRKMKDLQLLPDLKFDALAIGPGLGDDVSDEIAGVIVNDPRPAVIDADALNFLSAEPARLDQAASAGYPRLFTPHPGEMSRLQSAAGESDGDRTAQAVAFAHRYGVSVLLKGGRTVVTDPDGNIAYNSTGNAGMASGGMGDVLTGLCAALLAVTGDPFRAGGAAAWLAGRSADLLVDGGVRSIESLLPHDVADGLGRAFASLNLRQ